MNVLVTGGGRGIGRAIAVAFAEPGNTVAVAARTRPQLDDAARAIHQRGARAVVMPLDITDESAVARAFSELGQQVAGLDVLVNNAGIGGGDPVHKTDPAVWRKVVDTNVWGTFLVTRSAIPILKDGGRVIN